MDDDFDTGVFFTPISFDEWLQTTLEINPHAQEDELREALKRAISLKKEDRLLTRCFESCE